MLPLSVIITVTIQRTSMRLLLSTLLLSTSLFAVGEKIMSMQADFTQSITDDKNSTLVYKGKMLAKRPNMAKWDYIEPIEKCVYIVDKEVTVVEPELEQAIIKRLDNSIDILAILSSAVKVSKGHYIATYHDKAYEIYFSGDKIESIHFSDAFDNQVSITFTNEKINQKIDDHLFKAVIPLDFDVIKD